ncbi:hypothetical protein OHS33_38775 (plasmid) [Streptomyces sp. NBC_00536]|uniref:hypothetical protein n=1 Tax=Streptomyces sp. NBC_00536 TaxID=2975769 RepID=UPI000592212F|nr:hypothetical protein [Streptomyces sp. NBC_00536]KIF04137.1 hypothetical protein PL81_20185 [Streptomyces sp. RSD-27]WUC84448.1 hypothetical protein OHS33_38775 [Streptomyces sp. NBC_00536]
MMVTGTLEDGAAYEVQITGREDRPVIGSRRVRALVEQHTGRPVLLGPLGPRRMLSASDTSAVLALLRQNTAVVEVRP